MTDTRNRPWADISAAPTTAHRFARQALCSSFVL
jgi:hypothetical protein